MGNIIDYLNKIKTAVYGEEVRGAIHDSIRQCYDDGKSGAVDITAREQIANLVANNPTDPNKDSEVIDARVGADGVTYTSLGESIRKQIEADRELLYNLGFNISNSNLAYKIDKTYGGYLNIAGKVVYDGSEDRAYSYITEYIACKKGDTFYYSGYTYSNTAAACFYDENKKFISSINQNNIEYINGTKRAIITVPDQCRYVRFSHYAYFSEVVTSVFFICRLSQLYEAISNVYTRSDGYINVLNGEKVSDENTVCIYTDYIKCKSGDEFFYKGNSEYQAAAACFYDENKKFISGIGLSDRKYILSSLKAPIKSFFVRLCSYETVGSKKEPVMEIYVNKLLYDYPYKNELLEKCKNSIFEYEIYDYYNAYMSNIGDIITVGDISNAYNIIACSKITSITPCKPKDIFYYKGDYKHQTTSAVFYDYNMKILSTVAISSPTQYEEIVIPEDCYYVRFSSYAVGSDINNVILDIKKKNFSKGVESGNISSNIFSGKHYVACGDSFTEGDFTGIEKNEEIYDYVDKLYKTYPWQIAKRNNLRLTNLARCGDDMTDFMGKYKNIPEDADYITIALGLNDYSHSIPIGDINDNETNETFYGYWNTALDWIYKNRPYAHVGIIIMPAYMSNTYRDAEVAIGKKWGIPVLDLYRDERCPMFMNKEGADSTIASERYKLFKVTESNGHPNLKAHEFMSTFIEHWLRGI